MAASLENVTLDGTLSEDYQEITIGTSSALFLFNSSKSIIEYCVSDTAPDNSLVGFELKPGEVIQGASSNLFIKTNSGNKLNLSLNRI